MLKQTVIALALVGMSSIALAGNFQVKVGGSVLAPKSENGTLNVPLATGAVAPLTADISNEINFTPSVEYFFGDSGVSAELLLATPFKHTVNLGTIENAASFKHLPPTATVKYNFNNSTRFTPYVGIGATVVVPWDEELSADAKTAIGDAGAKLSADVAYGVAGQVGFNYQPADAKNWGVYFDARYADLKTDLEAETSTGTKVSLGELEVNPWVYTLGYSYRF